ncbi:MAG: hypothetical protein JXB49_36810 [Bacteroidales bacterium]|nr:hypothetical protein [Bacteroidales bacterium]
MKKLNLLLAFVAIAMIGFMSTSCSDEEAVGPTITLTADGITTDQTLETGETFTVAWIATKGDANLAEFTIMRDDQNIGDYPDTDIPNDNYQGSDVLTVPSNEGTYVYTLKVTDKDGLSDDVSLTITAEEAAPAGSISEVAASVKIMCTLGDGSGKSTCASADGTTYAPKTATATDQAKVDFVYFYQTSAGMYAPSAIPSSLSTAFSSWTTKNTTYFAKTTSIAYASATYADVSAAAASLSATSITGLNAGDNVVFKTSTNKVGIFTVTAVEPGYNSTDYITISIKLED